MQKNKIDVQIKESSPWYRKEVGYIFHGRDKYNTSGVEFIEVAFTSMWDRHSYTKEDIIILTPGIVWEQIPECQNPNCYGQCCDINMY